MATDYTAAEKRAIDRAWNTIRQLTDRHGVTDRLESAARYERRQRSSATVARALLVRGFLAGWMDNPRVADIALLSDGIATATIVGADMRARYRDRPAESDYLRAVVRRLRAECNAAATAHDSAIVRRFRRVDPAAAPPPA